MNYEIIVLLYSRKRLATVARIARSIRALAEPARTLLVVNGSELDDASIHHAFHDHERTAVLRHDNSGLEFGGYQAAIDSMREDLPPRLVIMNDTVGSHDPISHAYLVEFMRLLRMDVEKTVVGSIDTSQRNLLLCGLQSARWIRSHLFGMDLAALQATECRLYRPEIDRLITNAADPDRFFGEFVTGTLREHLSRWLFSDPTRGWYGAEPLSPGNCGRMAAKARAILQEKYLSMTWEAAGVAFRHPYLASRLARFEHSTEIAFGRLWKRLQRG